jgi:HPt (histidine-containing phosphotransfer) domain-containing protein
MITATQQSAALAGQVPSEAVIVPKLPEMLAETFARATAASNDFASQAETPPAASASDPGEACDRATLEELRAEGDNLLSELVAIFQIELTKGLDELAHALAVCDCPAVAHIAHTLKGTAGTFGAKRMHAMAASIDQAARAGQNDRAAALFADFRSECQRVRRFLAGQIQHTQRLERNPDGEPA